MTDRAVILPTPVDPFMLNYWLHGFNTIWGDEVTRLYIVVNSPIQKDVIDYVMKITDKPNITVLYFPTQIEHGDAINRALEIVQEKYVMLVEDDCYIFKAGVIDQCFHWLESGQYQIVGSKRGSCHPEILERAKQIWGLQYEGLGDQGCNFWPNLFFASKELLLRTDRNFGAKAWQKGTNIEQLGNYTVLNDVIYGDTFVWASLQLRAMVPEKYIKYIPQYHGHPDDLKHFEQQSDLFDGHAPWCHIGSLSSGVHGILMDSEKRPLATRVSNPTQYSGQCLPCLAKTEMEHFEYERRLQWWLTFVEFYEKQSAIVDPIPEFRKMYNEAILTAVGQMQLSIKRIRKRQWAYKTIGLW